MTARQRVYLPIAEPQAVASAVARAALGPDEMVAVLVAEAEAPDLDELVEALRGTGASFFGGLFPALIDGRRHLPRGALLFTLPRLTEPLLVTGLDTDHFTIPDTLPFVQWHRGSKPTALMLVDGLSPNISHFLRAIYHELGNRVSYWGGGAGSLTLRPRPCVFTREGVHQGAAIIALSSLPAQLGVRHGWQQIKGPFLATRSNGNVIIQLNWKNAFEVYRTTVEADTGVVVTSENFFQLASAYPFGIRKEGQEFVVRDPVAVNEAGHLTCIGDVPENAALAILKGETRHLVAAAGQAAREAMGDGAPRSPRRISLCLLADCVSRALFLGDRFPEELAAIVEGLGPEAAGTPPVGMLTLGEISSHGEGYLEFFNKTSVVAVVHES
jgi:hypothetical protein